MSKARSKHSSGTPPRLTVTMKGPKVGDARLSAADLAEIVKRTQQALKRVGRVLYGQDSQRQGRDRADIEQLCELFLIAWKPGSAVAQLELGAPPAQMDMFGYIGEESVKALVGGMPQIQQTNVTATNLPRGFDRGVLQTCDALAKVLDHGIDTITFESQNGRAGAAFTLDTPLRNRVRELLGQPVDVSSAAKTGRLEELNGHGALTGRLWEADGTKWMCHFKQEHIEQLPEAWMRTARVVGRAIVEEGKERVLEVESLVVLDDEMVPPTAREAAPFWKSLSLEELAEQQGVAAVSDLDAISALWPVDDDPDELLRHILHEREARRTLAEGGNAA
jgi:hypothetical protein